MKNNKVFTKNLKYDDVEVICLIENYSNGNERIKLYEKETTFPYLTATIGIDIVLDKSVVIIKDYSENEGVFAWLISNKIIKPNGQYYESGYVSCPIAVIVNDGFEEIDSKELAKKFKSF